MWPASLCQWSSQNNRAHSSLRGGCRQRGGTGPAAGAELQRDADAVPKSTTQG